MDNMTTTVELITPEIAKKYLEKNNSNRAIRGTLLASLVRDMKAGNFRTTHQGIAFDRYGNLIDGQHRLTACALSGVPIRVQVTRGLEQMDGAYIDIGAKRSFYDAITIGDEYADKPALRAKSTSSAIRGLVYYGYNSRLTLTFDEMRLLLDAFDEPLTNIYRAALVRAGKTTSTVASAGLAALICGESPEDIHAYFTVFLNGDTSKLRRDYNIAAAFNWQRSITEAKLHRDIIPKTDIYNATQNSIWQFIHGGASKFIRPTKSLRYPVYSQVKAVLNPEAKDGAE